MLRSCRAVCVAFRSMGVNDLLNHREREGGGNGWASCRAPLWPKLRLTIILGYHPLEEFHPQIDIRQW